MELDVAEARFESESQDHLLQQKFRHLDLRSDVEMLVMSFVSECEEELTVRQLLKDEAQKPIPRDPMEIPFVRWVVKFLNENGLVQLASQYKTAFFISLNKLCAAREQDLIPWLHSNLLDQVVASTDVTSSLALAQAAAATGTHPHIPEPSEDAEERADLYQRCLCAVSDEHWLELTHHCQNLLNSGNSDALLPTTFRWIGKHCGADLLDGVIDHLRRAKPAENHKESPPRVTSSAFSDLVGVPGLLREVFVGEETHTLVHMCSSLSAGGNEEEPVCGSEEYTGKRSSYLNSIRQYFIESLKSAQHMIWDDLQLSYMKFIGQEELDEQDKKARQQQCFQNGDHEEPQFRGHGSRLLLVDMSFKLYLGVQLSMPLDIAKSYQQLRFDSDSVEDERDVVTECGCQVLTELHRVMHGIMLRLVHRKQITPIYEQFNSLHWVRYYNSIMALIEGDEHGGSSDCSFLLPHSQKEFHIMNDAYRFALQQCVPHDAVIRRLELDYQKPLFGTANLLEELGKYVLVVMRGGKIVLGYVRAVDQHTNVVLGNTIERIHVGESYGEISVGTFLIRGDNIILLCEVDLTKEMLLMTKLKKVSEKDILAAQRAEMLEKEEKRKKMIDVLKQHQLSFLEAQEDDGF